MYDRTGVSLPEIEGALAYALAPGEREVRLRPARRIDLLAHLSAAFDLAEQQVPGHAARVAFLAHEIARALDLEAGGLRSVLYAGLLHGAGTTVRPGPGDFGGGAWVASRFGLDEPVQHAIQSTHERWDGRGGPHGLEGRAIPIEALCVSAALWAVEFADQEPNPLRMRWTLQHAPAGDINVLAGPDVAAATLQVLRDDRTWLSLWDMDLPALVARAGAEEEPSSRETVESVAAAMGAVVDAALREPGRARRVSELAVAIADELHLPSDTCHAIGVAGYLLDVGQLGIPRDVTDKPSILTVDEMELMRRHPGVGARILEYAPSLGDLSAWVEQHHERPDGRGYPEMLEVNELTLPPRILAVADAYWALRADRPYRPSFGEAEALEMVQGGAGQQFDVAAVEVLPRALQAIPEPLEQPGSSL